MATGLSRKEADRLQDDWLIGSSSLEQAEARLTGVIRAYQELGLDINGRKTGIRHVTETKFPKWRTELLKVRGGNKLAGERLGEFLRCTINEQIDDPGEAILPYVYAVLIGSKFERDDIPILQSFITRSVAVDSRVVDDACILLLNLNHEGYKLDRDRIASRFVPLVEAALEGGHTFEAIWALHLFRGLRYDLSATRVSELADLTEGSAVKLVMLDLQASGLLAKLPKKAWQKRIAASQFNDPQWLLAYEGIRHGWLSDSSGDIAAHPLFVPMFARNVQFYDPKRNVPRRANLRKWRLARTRLNFQLTLRDWFSY